MAKATGAGSRRGVGEAGAPQGGARTNGHLARVTVLAVAALAAAQWLAAASH
ncbi:hypothetical protein [Streptomyces sp. NPDC012510]|uniref:hypothetical protein n=1 Tax=Streptomyces sp. NPDC012510 TaxID=3364838 RepID=UPI0036E7E38B